MNWSEKYTFLFEMYDNSNTLNIRNNVDLIKKLSIDTSPQIRGLVAKVCSQFNSSESLELLLSLSNDSNDLVRVEVADSLSCFTEDVAYQKLIALCDDRYYMVRGYAEYGIGLTGNTQSRKKQSVQTISEKITKERRYFNRLQCHMALYFLGYEKELDTILQTYPRLRYQDQCVVLNFLQDIISNSNKEVIAIFLSNVKKDRPESVDFLIVQLFKKIHELRKTGDGSLC